MILSVLLLSACGQPPITKLTAISTLPATESPANPSPVASTATPALPTITPMPAVFAIIDGETHFLIGGSQNGIWLSADMTAPYLGGGEVYRLFSKAEYLGDGIGAKTSTIEGGPCARNYTVALDPEPAFVPALAVGGNWEVAPRKASRIAPVQVYKDEIEALLIAQGIADPEVAIIEALKVDLEGDGVDEVLLIAINMEGGTVLPSVEAGNYSLIVMRKIIDGAVVTLPLVMDIYLEAEVSAYPTVYTVGAVYDLNGDGRLDVILEGRRWEGRSVTIFDIDGEMALEVLSVSCAE